jgi:hypothetical protein
VTHQTLDEQIVAVGSLVSLLLVFVFAFFSALLPRFEELRARDVPVVEVDRARFRAELSSSRALAWGILAVVVLVFLVLTPLSWRVVNAALWSPFRTLRVTLLVVDLLLVATGAGVVAEIVLLTRKRREAH